MDRILYDLVGKRIGKYEIVENKGEGVYGITYKALDISLGNVPVAIKFLKNPESDPGWKEEALRAAQLRDVDQIASIYEVNEGQIRINNTDHELKYLVWAYVNGEQLSKHLKSSAPVTADFILEIIRQLCLGIKAMQEAGLEHGDLHPGNILLIPPKAYESPFNFRVKIVDFGLSKTFLGDRYRNDMEWVTKLLLQFWDKNKYYIEDLHVHDKKFSQAIPNLIKELEDPSPERRLDDPMDAIRVIEEIKQSTKIEISEAKGELKHPFEYLSAEEMPENSDLLYSLYSSRLPWYYTLEGFGTSVISGPRGCGKSMILKNLRLITKLMSKDYREKRFGKEKYVGLYIHCHRDIYLPFAGLSINYTDKKIQDAFIHYINLLFIQEVLLTLKLVEQLKLRDIITSAKVNLVDFVKGQFLQNEPVFLKNVDLISDLTTLLEKEQVFVQRQIINGIPIRKCTSVGCLNDISRFVKDILPDFSDKQIYFILDDYSVPKVNIEIQKAFNRIIGVRNNSYCFKISSEKFSFIPTDFDLEKENKEFQQDREYTYLDLGGKYLSHPKEQERREFIREIIDKRLKRTPEVIMRDTLSLFGIYKFPKGDVARSLIADFESKKKKKRKRETLYAGLDIIYKLCAGDIATILQLCREIYDTARLQNKIPQRIEENISFVLQDKVVRDFSKRRAERIKEIPTYGQHIYHIVEVFGEIAKKYLYRYGKITRDKDRYYEILGFIIKGSGKLNQETFNLYKTLLLEGIFTDAGGRYPWGKGLLNNSLILRPIYTPALQVSYRRRECFRIPVNIFKNFLMNPDNFKKTGTKFLKRTAGGKAMQSLFDEDIELDRFEFEEEESIMTD